METNIRLKLGKRIKELRKKCGYTQDKLSEITEIDYKYIQRIEGKTPPNLKLETLERLAKVFKLPLSKFLDFK
jgi:transcriptional regulator with XRE-family HTH domain